MPSDMSVQTLSVIFIIIISTLGDCFSIDELLYDADHWKHYGFSPRKGQPCRTPNGEPAYCLSLFTCPTLLLALGSLQPFALDFVKKSLCQPHPEDVIACCGTLGNYTKLSSSPTAIVVKPLTFDKQVNKSTTVPPRPGPINRNFQEHPLLSNRKYCGFQHNDDRISSDSSIALDEFPWLVHIVFLDDEDEDPEQYLDRCNGVLINNRYVLTTDYCGTYPKSVKLGQFNTNKTVACLNNGQLQECTEPILEIAVEEEIHKLNSSDAWHNFALLRLAEKIHFSDFVRPICLPLDDSEVIERSELVFSGWGATNQTGIDKKRLKYRPTNLSECEKLDDKGLKNVTSVVPVCLLPKEKNGVLACTGDESGPLMYSNQRLQWFADALITRIYSKLTDPDFCSNELPITSIKITMDTVQWIVDHIRP